MIYAAGEVLPPSPTPSRPPDPVNDAPPRELNPVNPAIAFAEMLVAFAGLLLCLRCVCLRCFLRCFLCRPKRRVVLVDDDDYEEEEHEEEEQDRAAAERKVNRVPSDRTGFPRELRAA